MSPISVKQQRSEGNKPLGRHQGASRPGSQQLSVPQKVGGCAPLYPSERASYHAALEYDRSGLGVVNFSGGDVEDVLVQHDEVCQLAGLERSETILETQLQGAILCIAGHKI